jgi:hypothetical protein
MRTGDLSSGATGLQKSWAKLRAHWDRTKDQWHDPVSRDFQEQYLDAIEPQIKATLERMRSLAGLLASAQQECQD